MKDVGVRLKVGAEGLENLRTLRRELQQAGVDTAAFDKAIAALNAEFARLAREQALIDKFRQQKRATEELKTAYEAAGITAQSLARDIAASDGPTKDQAREFAQARAAVRDANEEYSASRLKLQQLREELSAAGIASDQLASAQVRVGQELAAAKAAAAGLGDQAEQLARNAQAARAAAEEEQQLNAAVAQSRASTATTADVAPPTSPLIAQLREQIALYDKSAEEILSYRAAQAGVGAEAQPLITQLRNMRAAHEAAAAAARDQAQAEREAAQAEANAARTKEQFLANLREQVALQGKSAGDQLRFRASQLGVSAEAAKDIDAYEAGVKKLGVSSAQTAAAMRQLPAQITDITTQLAAGAPVLLVALQQGGQIKDSFGGIGPAFKALRGAISPLTLGFGALAAVVGVVAIAVNQLQKEEAAYSAAIVASNNASGTSIGVLRDRAREVSKVAGTTGQAADALAQLVATGRVADADLTNAATIAIQSQRLLGREVSATAQIYAQLGKDPVQTLLRLNEGTNFLTAATLRQVMALKSLGKDSEAAALAQQAFGEQQKKVLADAEKNLGTLQRAWKAVADAAKGAWDAMLDIGRPKGAQEQIAAQERAVQALRDRVASGRGTTLTKQRLEAAERRLAELREEAQTEQQAAAAAAQQVEDNQKQLDELDPARIGARAGVARAEAARQLAARLAGLEQLREATLNAFLLGEQDAATHEAKLVELERARVRAQIAEVDRLRKIEADRPTRDQNDALQKQASLTQLDTQRAGLALQLDKQRADQKQQLARVLDSATEANEEAGRRLEAAMAGEAASIDKAEESMARFIKRYGQALGITDQLAKRLIDTSKDTDLKGQLERAARALPEIQIQFLEATGEAAEASALQIERRFTQLRQDLLKAGNLDAVAKIDVIINVEKAKTKLNKLRDEVEQIFAQDQLAQQRIESNVRALRLSPSEAQDQRVGVSRNTAARLEQQLPAIQAQVDQLPDGADKSRLLTQLEQYRQRIVELRDEVGLLQQSFTQAFGAGLANAIEGLATGTLSLRDAARGLLLDIARGMAQVAAQELASLATKKLLILATGQQAAASVAAQGTQAAAATGAITTVAGAQTAASAEVAAAAAPAAAATATWSWGAAALAGLAALAAIYALAKGFETGGQIRGPGTGTSDSIPIWASNGEFMVRERSVSQPGALPFLQDFNRFGMRAVEAWRGYATGGLIGAPAMSLSAQSAAPANFEPASPAAGMQSGISALRLVNVLDPKMLDDWANTPSFERLIVNTIGRNPQAVRNVLG